MTVLSHRAVAEVTCYHRGSAWNKAWCVGIRWHYHDCPGNKDLCFSWIHPVMMAWLTSPLWWLCPQIQDYAEPFREAMWLDLVKERLTEKVYTVAWFVRDMRLIFHNHKTFYKVKHVPCFLLTSFLLSPNLGDDRTLHQLSPVSSWRGLSR